MQEQVNQLEAAVLAAGVTTVYNADDWDHGNAAPEASGAASPEAPTQH
jgi:hypothetical protein